MRATPSFYRTFQVSKQDTDGQILFDLGNRQWDIPELRESLTHLLPRDTAFENFRVDHDFPSIGHRSMILNARQIHPRSGGEPLILLAIEDVTLREHADRARLAAGREEERRLIASELHDDLVQQLAGLAVDIGRQAAEPAKLLEKELRSLQTRVVRAAEAARQVAYKLHPTELDDLGLEEALRLYCEEFGHREGIAVEFNSQNLPPTFSREIAYCLYKVAQESLRNIAKHAQAKQAAVSIEGTAEWGSPSRRGLRRRFLNFVAKGDCGSWHPRHEGTGTVSEGEILDRFRAREGYADFRRGTASGDASMRRARILVADDHSIILAGVRSLLEQEWELAGHVEDGRSLVEAALKLRPDLMIVDIGMPVLNGIDALKQIRKVWPEAKVLFLTMHANLMYLKGAMRAGGSGYVLKSSAAEELRPAIRKVLKGQVFVSAAFGPDVLGVLQTPSGRQPTSTADLTDRQRQVLQLVAEGRKNSEIAKILNVSIKTAQFHRGQIMRKLGVHSAVKLTQFAVQNGLVNE